MRLRVIVPFLEVRRASRPLWRRILLVFSLEHDSRIVLTFSFKMYNTEYMQTTGIADINLVSCLANLRGTDSLHQIFSQIFWPFPLNQRIPRRFASKMRNFSALHWNNGYSLHDTRVLLSSHALHLLCCFGVRRRRGNQYLNCSNS